MRVIIKRMIQGICVVLVSPAAALCWLEHKFFTGAEEVFSLFAQTFALLPGLPGVYLRRAFFKLTLSQCAGDWYIGFGSLFTHREAVVEEGVYIGSNAQIGCAVLRKNCLIGSHSSLLSGLSLHEWNGRDGWSPSDRSRFRQIEIGAGSWIGERAVVMASIGPGAMVAAGSVVSSQVPAGVMVGGNPSRFINRMTTDGPPVSATAHRA